VRANGPKGPIGNGRFWWLHESLGAAMPATPSGPDGVQTTRVWGPLSYKQVNPDGFYPFTFLPFPCIPSIPWFPSHFAVFAALRGFSVLFPLVAALPR